MFLDVEAESAVCETYQGNLGLLEAVRRLFPVLDEPAQVAGDPRNPDILDGIAKELA